MSQQPVEANVVLTADTGGYDQALTNSAQQTQQLGTEVDSLTAKIDRLAKSGGKKMLTFAAVDFAGIAGATTAYAAFEKQMSSLHAQAAILHKTVAGQKSAFADYTNSVNKLRKEFPVTTAEAAQLTQTLSKMGDGTQKIENLARTFTKLGTVTGESSTGLANSLLGLQKVMGAPQRDTERYANTLTSLAATTNSSAAAIADFSAQIAPVGRSIGMTTTDVMGVSSAFIRAGQDGYRAGNAFNRMMSDIAYASQTGSPDLAKYANLVGMTVQQFKELGGAEKAINVFEALNKQGSGAITTLNRMGLDGMNTMRSITAMSQQTGGIGAAISQARNADPGALKRGVAAANSGMFDSLKKMRNELAMTGEAIGKSFAWPADKAAAAMERMAGAANAFFNSPIGKLASWAAGAASGIGLLGGVLLTAAAALTKFGMAAWVLKGSGVQGFMDARRGYRYGGRDSVTGAPIIGSAPGAAPLSRGGQAIAAGRGNFIARGLYSVGLQTGAMRRDPAVSGLYQRSLGDRALYNWTGGRMGRPGTPGFWSQAAALPIRAATWGGNMLAMSQQPGTPAGIRDFTSRPVMFKAQQMSDYGPGARRFGTNTANWFRSNVLGQQIAPTATGYTPQQQAVAYGTARTIAQAPAAAGLVGGATGMAQTQIMPLSTLAGFQSAQAAAGMTAAVQAAQPSWMTAFKQNYAKQIMAQASKNVLGEAFKTAPRTGTVLPRVFTVNAFTPDGQQIKTPTTGLQQTRINAAGTNYGMPVVSVQGMGGLPPAAAGPATPAASSTGRLAGPMSRMANRLGVYSSQALNYMIPGSVSEERMGRMAANSLNAGKTAAALNNMNTAAGAAAKGLGGAAQASRGFAGMMANVTKAFAMTGVGAGGWGAGLGLKGLGTGLAAMGPMNLAMIGGMIGFTVYDSMRDKTKYTKSDESGFLNPYLEAAGVVAPAALGSAPTAKNAVETDKYDAMHITNRESFDAKAGSYKPSNTKYKEMSRNEIIQSLAPQWHKLKDQPAGIQPIAMDLTNRFDRGTAEDILRDMDEGSVEFDPTPFVNQAWSQRKVGRESVGKHLNKLQGVMDDRQAMVKDLYNEEEAFQERKANFNKAMEALLKDAPKAMPWRETRGSDALNDYLSANWFGSSTKDNLFTSDNMHSKWNQFRSGFGGLGGTDGGMTRSYMGGKYKGLNAEQREKLMLQDFFANEGNSQADKLAFLDRFGLDRMLIKTPQKAINQILAQGTTNELTGKPGADPNSMLNQLISFGGMTGLAAKQFNMPSVQEAMKQPENMNLQMQAIDDLIRKFHDLGFSTTDVIRSMKSIQGAVGEVSDQLYMLAGAVSDADLRQASYEMPLRGHAEQFQFQAGIYESQRDEISGLPDNDPKKADKEKKNTEDFLSYAVGEAQRMQQAMLAKEQFDKQMRRGAADFELQQERSEDSYQRSRRRAAADYHRQQKWMDYDFQLGRKRGEEDYHRGRMRQIADYERSQRRAQYEFNLSRKRQEEDYQHQVKVMTEEAARSVYNIYERIRVQRTASADWLLHNAADQLEQLQQQTQNLDKLRSAGMSDKAIQQLGLTDASNAQQLSRFVADVAENPQLVQEFNTAVGKRLKAAKALVTDQSSTQWQEFQRSHKLSTRRAQEDFRRQTGQSHDDFNRQLRIMERDFRRGMARQNEDYETAQHRQQISYKISIGRAAKDYGIAMGQMTDDYHKSVRRAKKDMDDMAKEMSMGLEETFTKAAKMLHGNLGKQARIMLSVLKDLDLNFEQAGIQLIESAVDMFGVPWKRGKTGGRSTAGRAPEGEAEHGSKWHKQSGGGDGGYSAPVTPIAKGQYVNTAMYGDTGKNWSSGKHTGDDYAAAMGTPIHAALPGVVVFTGTAGAYGNLTKIGHGNGLETWYAHQSKIDVKKGQPIDQNQVIGEVGATGNVTGPHVHFEVRVNGSPVDPSTLGKYKGAKNFTLDDLLADRYPKLERAAGRLTLGDPSGFFPDGWISDKFNDMAQRGLEKWAEANNVDLSVATGMGDPGHAPKNLTMNQRIVKKMADNRYDWDGKQWDALYQLIMSESGFDNTAQNPTSTAYGIFQFLDSTWKAYGKKTSDPTLQTRYGLEYVQDRYGDPMRAWNFKQANNWYAAGGIFSGTQTIGVGERGPEIVMPLDRNGVDFIATLMNRLSPGIEGRAGSTAQTAQPVCNHITQSYQVDRSTTFSGAITVQANDPNEMLSKLQARARTQALSQPLLAGRRL